MVCNKQWIYVPPKCREVCSLKFGNKTGHSTKHKPAVRLAHLLEEAPLLGERLLLLEERPLLEASLLLEDVLEELLGEVVGCVVDAAGQQTAQSAAEGTL